MSSFMHLDAIPSITDAWSACKNHKQEGQKAKGKAYQNREQELMMASSNNSSNVLMAGPTVGTRPVHEGLGLGPLQFDDGFNMHGQNELQLQQQNVQRHHQYVDVAGNLGIHNPNPHQQQNCFVQHQRA